jgi:hypothetical protein
MKKGRSDHADSDGLFQEVTTVEDHPQSQFVSQANCTLSRSCCFLKAAGLQGSHSEPLSLSTEFKSTRDAKVIDTAHTNGSDGLDGGLSAIRKGTCVCSRFLRFIPVKLSRCPEDGELQFLQRNRIAILTIKLWF